MNTPDYRFATIPSHMTLAPLRDAAVALCPAGSSFRVRVTMAIREDGDASYTVTGDTGANDFADIGWGYGKTPEQALAAFAENLKPDPRATRIAELQAELARLEGGAS